MKFIFDSAIIGGIRQAASRNPTRCCCYKFFEHPHGRDMEQGKTNLATSAVIIASSVSPIGSQAEEVVSPRIMSYVKTVTCDHFASNLDNVRVNPLAGGYGAAANVQLEIAGKAYVLRVISELESPLKRNTELYAMKEAAAVGTAPAIRWISPDGYAILMDYIAGGTLTIEKGKKPEITFKVADLMRKVHSNNYKIGAKTHKQSNWVSSNILHLRQQAVA